MEELYMPSDGGELSFLESNGDILLEQGSQNIIQPPDSQSNIVYMPSNMCYMEPSQPTVEVNTSASIAANSTPAGQQIIILQTNPISRNVILQPSPQPNIVLANDINKVQHITIGNTYAISNMGHSQPVQMGGQKVPAGETSVTTQNLSNCNFAPKRESPSLHVQEKPPIIQSPVNSIPEKQLAPVVNTTNTIGWKRVEQMGVKAHSSKQSRPSFTVQCPSCKSISSKFKECSHCGAILNIPIVSKMGVKTSSIPITKCSQTDVATSSAPNEVKSTGDFMLLCNSCQSLNPPTAVCLKCKKPLGENCKVVIKQKTREKTATNEVKNVFTVIPPQTRMTCKQCGTVMGPNSPCSKCFTNMTIANSNSLGMTIANHSQSATQTNQGTQSVHLKLENLEKGVLCKNCGICSENFTTCSNCKHKIDKGCKLMTFAPVKVPKKIDTNLFEKKIKPKPVGRSRARVREEPVCLTLSSDEEEESASVQGSKPESESSSVKNPPQSKLLHCKEPILGDQDNVQSLDSSHLAMDSPIGTRCRLLCNQIRIGTYQSCPKERILIHPTGIKMLLPPVTPNKPDVTIDLRTKFFLKILANFDSVCPCIFIYLNPSIAQAVRTVLGMSDTSQPYFDPANDEQAFRRIILFTDKVTKEVGDYLRGCFKAFKANGGSPLMEEIPEKDANHILSQSYLKEGQEDIINQTLLTYSPEPNRGAISITTADFLCLEEDKFLNDVIIDFYLKWLVTSKLSPADKERTHVFSTYFYKRLTARPKKNRRLDPSEYDPSLSASQKRHSRVQSWTKNVDIFQKDFIIIPINEHSHWFLAIICFPGMGTDGLPVITSVKRKVKKNISIQIPFLKEESSDRDEASSDDDLVTEDESEAYSQTPPPQNTPFRQPCIIICDSLTGSSRSRIVATLREYLTVEYVRKKGISKPFTKHNIRGACPAVPQQTNFSDCGIFTLQFAESFFENPLKDFNVPIRTLRNWFPQSRIHRKRGEIAELIKSLMADGNPGHNIVVPTLKFRTDFVEDQQPDPNFLVPSKPLEVPEIPESTMNIEMKDVPQRHYNPAVIMDSETSEVLLIVNRDKEQRAPQQKDVVDLKQPAILRPAELPKIESITSEVPISVPAVNNSQAITTNPSCDLKYSNASISTFSHGNPSARIDKVSVATSTGAKTIHLREILKTANFHGNLNISTSVPCSVQESRTDVSTNNAKYSSVKIIDSNGSKFTTSFRNSNGNITPITSMSKPIEVTPPKAETSTTSESPPVESSCLTTKPVESAVSPTKVSPAKVSDELRSPCQKEAASVRSKANEHIKLTAPFQLSSRSTSSGRRVATPKRFLDDLSTWTSSKRGRANRGRDS